MSKNEEEKWDEIEDELDLIPIPEQVERVEKISMEVRCGIVYVDGLIHRLNAARRMDVLTPKQYATVARAYQEMCEAIINHAEKTQKGLQMLEDKKKLKD